MANQDDSSKLNLNDITRDFIQIHQDINTRSAIALGTSVAIAVGVMAVLGRFVFSFAPSVSLMGYLFLFLFSIPLILTYTERIEAIGSPGGLYGLVRKYHGLTMSFMVGWLELAGYAAVMAILARTIAIYGLTLYASIGGTANISVVWTTIGVIVFLVLFNLTGWHSSRKLNTVFVFVGLLLLVGLAVYSLFNHIGNVRLVSSALKSIKPLQLSAMLFSSFWGILLVFGLRHRIIRSGQRSMISLNVVIMLILAVVGALLSIAVIPSGMVTSTGSFLSVNTYSAIVFTGNQVFTAIIAVFTLFLAFIGLERSLQASVETMTMMTNDAFFPQKFNYRFRKHILPPLLIVSILAIILIYFAETLIIVGVAAAFLLAATILIHVPDVLRPEPRLPRERRFKLPYHPLFPALTVLVATIVMVNLKLDVLKWAGGWTVFGIAVLSIYSYRRALKKRGATRTFGDEEELVGQTMMRAELPEGPILMALIRNVDDLEEMIRIGGKLAKRMQATLVVMQIIEVPYDITERERQKQGEAAWRALSERIQEIDPGIEGLAIRPMVRLTHKLIRGVINAAQEVLPKLMLVPPDFASDDPAENIEEYDSILRQAPGDIIFLSDFPPLDEIRHISVLIGTGNQSHGTLFLAEALVPDDGIIEVIHILEPGIKPEDRDARLKRIHELLEQHELGPDRAKITILEDVSLEDAVAELVGDTDLLILGAAKNFMSRRATFGGINAYIFQNTTVPIMLVRVYEKIRFAWLSQLWETLTRPLPKLTIIEREEVAQDILNGAAPSIDFFVLILLSSGIALYGLLQNSGAVIIGAMLVAPLMSPIIALGMSMVRGDLKTLGTAAQTTAQGVLVAISVGAVLTFFSPIRGTTNEILSRVSPNLLDLGIAFLSGAAGGYAMTRRNIAAALPGVAIAAALVPPLAVVGYGFATADLGIATGALMLFLTNLVAIVLAASLVFLALDFLTPEKQTWHEVMRGLRITAVFLVLVIIVLGTVTFKTVSDQSKQRAIENVLSQSLYSKNFEPLDVQISGSRKGYRIKATVLSFDEPLTSQEIDQLGQDLEEAVGAPVSLDLKSIPAHEGALNFATIVTTTEIEETVRKIIEEQELPVDVLSVEAESLPAGYSVTLAVMEYKPQTVTQELVNQLEATLAEKYNSPFKIVVYSVPVERLEIEPTPTVTPTPAP